MYLSRLYIKNFRSISELDLQFTKGKNVIVGRNNAGKSNIIKAIDLVLGESAPAYAKSENITDGDFYTWKERNDNTEEIHTTDDIFIWCELTRDEGEVLNYDELYKCYGFYIFAVGRYQDQTIHRIEKTHLPQNYESIFGENEDNNPGKIYINPKQRQNGVLEHQFEDKYSFAYAFRAQKNEDGRISKDIRFFYRENSESDWIMSFRATIRNELLQSAIIPSFRDPQNQLRLTNWTWYGKLMRFLTDGYERDAELISAFEHVNSVAQKVFSEVSETVNASSLNIAFPGTTVSFQFNAENRSDLYKSCIIYIDDGFKSQITEKGSGIQSAMIIGLFNYYVKHVNTISSALLCIEEPEIYLHPHARRVINQRLDEFIDNNRNQVIITTHSIEFLQPTSSDVNITLVQKESTSTTAKYVNTRDFKHLLIDNNQNELFFADKVIICEGFDHYIIKAISEEIFPGSLDSQNISLISVCGKDNIHKLVKLILDLGKECYIMTDFDYLLRDQDSEANKRFDTKPHKSIISLGSSFFCQPCTLADEGQEIFNETQRLRNKIKSEHGEQFYTAKTISDIPEINLSEFLKNLRKHGICILTGEIEHLSQNSEFLSPQSNKLTLDKVYEMHKRIAAGECIYNLIDPSQIIEFLIAVFN